MILLTDEQALKYSKTCLKQPLKKMTKNCFSRLINAGQKYSFIKLPFVFKTFVLSIFEWPLKTDFTVNKKQAHC